MMRELVVAFMAMAFPLTQASDKPVPTADARNVTVTVDDTSDADFRILHIKFDATLLNRGRADLVVSEAPIKFLGDDIRVESGEWKPLSRGDVVYAGEDKPKACATIRPGRSFDLPRISVDSVLRKTDRRTRSKIILRFHLQSICRAGDQSLIQDFVTSAIELDPSR